MTIGRGISQEHEEWIFCILISPINVINSLIAEKINGLSRVGDVLIIDDHIVVIK